MCHESTTTIPQPDIAEILERVRARKVSLDDIGDLVATEPVGENEEVLGDIADHPRLLGLWVEMSRHRKVFEGLLKDHRDIHHSEGTVHPEEDCMLFHKDVRCLSQTVDVLKDLFFLEADTVFQNHHHSSGLRDGTKYVRMAPQKEMGGSGLGAGLAALLGRFPGIHVMRLGGRGF